MLNKVCRNLQTKSLSKILFHSVHWFLCMLQVLNNFKIYTRVRHEHVFVVFPDHSRFFIHFK